MPRRIGLATGLGTALLALLTAGCEPFSRPNRPLPELAAIGLDGASWSRERLAGKPWVINLWVPR